MENIFTELKEKSLENTRKENVKMRDPSNTMDVYQITHHGDRAICPVCNGLLRPDYSLNWICSDCGTFFFPVRSGQTERELRYGFILGPDQSEAVA